MSPGTEKLSKSSWQIKSTGNSNMLHMFTSSTYTDFRTANKILIPSSLFEWFNRTNISQNLTLINCLANKGQDQHLKLKPRRNILLYKVFFDKKHNKPLQGNICGSNSFSPLGTRFVLIPHFQIRDRKLSPNRNWGTESVLITMCNKVSYFSQIKEIEES